MDDRSAMVDEVLQRLRREYPDSTISLRFSNRLELLVAVMLSAQCTDKRVNKVTKTLFEQYQTVEDYANADVETLADDIYGITYHNQKARRLTNACQQLLEEHDGEIPDSISALTALPGVGRKTANVVLQHGHNSIEGIVVDTHVRRLTRRLGLTDSTTPRAIEDDLIELVPKRDWVSLTHLLIDHGRAVCTARNPSCSDCVLADLCPSSKLDDGTVDLDTGEPWPNNAEET